MKKRDVKKSTLITIIAAVSILFILLYIFSDSIKNIVNVIIYSSIFAYILKPCAYFLKQKLNISSKKASLLVIIIVIDIVITCVLLIIPIAINEMSSTADLEAKTEQYIDDFTEKFNLKSTPIVSDIYNMIAEKEEYIA